MNKIGNFELTLLLISAMLGVGILSLPRQAAQAAGIDGIISIFLSGILISIFVFIYAKLALKYKDKVFTQYCETIVGKIACTIIMIVLSIYFVITMAVQVRIIGDTIKQYLLINTPLEVIIIALIVVSIVSVNYGLISISRISSNYMVFSILALLIMLLLNLKYVDIETFYSLGSNSIGKILSGSFKLSSNYFGFSIILFVAPFLYKQRDIIKISLLSTFMLTLLYAFTIFIAFGSFQILPNQYIHQPTTILSKTVFIRGFAERIDLLFMLFWIVTAFLSIVIKWFMISNLLTKAFFQKDYKVFTVLIMPILYLISLLPQNTGQVEEFTEFTLYSAWLIGIPIIILIYIISLFRKEGVK